MSDERIFVQCKIVGVKTRNRTVKATGESINCLALSVEQYVTETYESDGVVPPEVQKIYEGLINRVVLVPLRKFSRGTYSFTKIDDAIHPVLTK